MSDNPFGAADAWDVSADEYLGVGNHVVTIVEQEDANSQNGNPKLVLRLENAAGSIRDWVPYSETFLGKIVSVYDAAYGGDQSQRPGEGEFDPADHFRLTEACRNRLLKKKVGIVVRLGEERMDKNGNPKQWPEVKGYVPVSELSKSEGSSVAGTTAAVDPTPSFSSATAVDDDIPFFRDTDWFDGTDQWRGHSNR